MTTLRRLSHLRTIWRDEDRYNGVVESGRYMKLVHATGCAEEALDAAAQRLSLAVIAAHARAGQPDASAQRLRA